MLKHTYQRLQGITHRTQWLGGTATALLVMGALSGCQAPIDPNAPGFYLMQPNGKPASNMRFQVKCEDGTTYTDVTDRAGNTHLKYKVGCNKPTITILGKA